jgi:pimeloyl-ACP methyl ester carboxylesterase
VSPSERTVPIRDGAVTFRVATAGSGPSLMWLHSFHDRELWSPFLDRLATRCTVYAPAHPGVPGSTGVETLDDVYDLTLAYDELLDALDAGTPFLGGHGFGGMVAAELAALAPARVAALALVAPLGLWLDEAPVADLLVLPPDDLRQVLWRDPAGAVAEHWMALPSDDTENVEAQFGAAQQRAAMAKFVWPIPDRGLRKRLHRIGCRTLVLWGESDRANPPVYARLWQVRVRRAAVQIVPGAHMLVHEDPVQAADAVTKFLDTAAGGMTPR